VVFATEQGQARSGIWVGWLDRTQAPRQLTFGGEYRAFFYRPGQILYQGAQTLAKIMSINEDGSGRVSLSDLDIMQLQSVSPDGRWALVGVTPPGGHGDRNAMAIAVPLAGVHLSRYVITAASDSARHASRLRWPRGVSTANGYTCRCGPSRSAQQRRR
jgi:hypothetical protein